MTIIKSSIRTVMAVSAIGIAAHAAEPVAKLPAEQVEFFEKKIRPVLVGSCYQCHSAEASKAKGGLYLDNKEALLRGGDSGPAVVAGKPEKSLLIKAIRGNDKDLVMPPKGDHLTPDQVADFEKWIAMGVPDPRVSTVGATKGLAVDMEKAKAHWAFQPIANPAAPKVSDPKHWVKSPVDSFILAKLQEKGLQPSPAADKRALIRRATYDLTGLPPTPEEVAAFEADKSPDAFAKVVDRLLASPRYGERWGRHWLDIARYGDTSGDRVGGNRADPRFPFAWTYRDYVIEAFNRDLPYDQFIIQQIAADKLPGESKGTLAALGFLTVGKRFMGNENDVIDDRIDVVTQGLMGMTASCARCHDHKFDPIPTKDYYSLHGVFASSVEPTDRPVIAPPRSKEAYDDYLKKVADVEAETKAFREKEMARVLGGIREKVADYLMVGQQILAADGKLNRNQIARKNSLDLAILQNFEESLRRWNKSGDAVMAPWFEFAALKPDDFAAGAKQISARLASSPGKANPIVAAAFAKTPPATLADAAKIYGTLFHDAAQAYDEAKTAKTTASSEQLLDATQDAVRLVAYGNNSPMQVDERALRRILGNQYQTRENAIRNQVVTLNMSHPGAPVRAMALEDSPRPRDSKVFVRGEARNLGPVVPRQFLGILSGEQRTPFKNGSGRLELAQSVANRSNPLTARVIVNRVWQRHFGEALVRTPSDFGLRSEPPTHPEMLDYLATSFMDSGWSIKQLHRQIMLTSVYQQDSKVNEKAMELDPANQLVWRMNLRRLDFEEIRDSLLFVGGSLNLTMGGPSVALTDVGEYRGANRGNRYATPEVNSGPVSRRSVYSLVDRDRLPEIFRIFDFANPDMSTGQRYLTTVPQQALFMMNSPFVADQARRLVARPDLQPLTDDAKVSRLYEVILQRKPTPSEVNAAMEFVSVQPVGVEAAVQPVPVADTQTPAERKAAARKAAAAPQKESSKPLTRWEQLTQVLLVGNEAVFVN